MAPPQFGDFSKSITDLFDRSGFGNDKKIKATFKTPPVYGGAITVSEEIKGFDDFEKGFAAKVSAKWSHACGFAINKFDNDLSKGTVLETSFNKFSVPGLNVAVNMKQSYGKAAKQVFPLEVTYSNDFLATSVATEAPGFKECKANLTLATEGLTVGTSLTFASGSPTDYPVSLKYASGSYAAACEATDEFKCFTLLGSYKASSQLSLGGKFMIPDGSKDKVSVVGKYNLQDEFGTKVSAMYSHANGFGKKGDKPKTLEVSVVAAPLAKVETGVALAFPLSNLGAYTYGLNFTLG